MRYDFLTIRLGWPPAVRTKLRGPPRLCFYWRRHDASINVPIESKFLQQPEPSRTSSELSGLDGRSPTSSVSRPPEGGEGL